MFTISSSWKHHPHVIQMQKLTESKLGYPHTRSERIAEVKKLIESFPVGSTNITYCNCLLDELNRNNDSEYHNRITFLYQISEEYQKLLPKRRDIKDMNWYIWEAVVTDLATAESLGLVTKETCQLAVSITNETKRTNHFDDHLRALACDVEQHVETHRAALDAHYDKEDAERVNCPGPSGANVNQHSQKDQLQ